MLLFFPAQDDALEVFAPSDVLLDPCPATIELGFEGLGYIDSDGMMRGLRNRSASVCRDHLPLGPSARLIEAGEGRTTAVLQPGPPKGMRQTQVSSISP